MKKVHRFFVRLANRTSKVHAKINRENELNFFDHCAAFVAMTWKIEV